MTCRRNGVEGDVSRGANKEFLSRDRMEEAVVLGLQLRLFPPSVTVKKKGGTKGG